MRNTPKHWFGVPARLALFALFLSVSVCFPAHAAKTQYRWERIHVMHIAPTQLFVKLGLTHSVKYGHTRGQVKEPDPNFPVGLTDIVPYDSAQILLVRGTDKGLSLFRQSVALADVPRPEWQLTAELLDATGTVLAAFTQPSVTADTSFPMALGQSADAHSYRCRLHVNPDNSLMVTCQSGVPIEAASNSPVFVPSLVWSSPISKAVTAGMPVIFDDSSQARQEAHAQIGSVSEPSATDYQLRVTVISKNTAAPLVSTPSVPTAVTPAPTTTVEPASPALSVSPAP